MASSGCPVRLRKVELEVLEDMDTSGFQENWEDNFLQRGCLYAPVITPGTVTDVFGATFPTMSPTPHVYDDVLLPPTSGPFDYLRDDTLPSPVETIIFESHENILLSTMLPTLLDPTDDTPTDDIVSSIISPEIDIEVGANWIYATHSIHPWTKGTQIFEDAALLEIGGTLADGISMARSDSPMPMREGIELTPFLYQRHPKEAVSIMRSFYELNTQYPVQIDVCRISKQTGLTTTQVETWFTNERTKHNKDNTNIVGVHYKNKNSHPAHAIKLLQAWVDSHSRKPSCEEKEGLSEKSNLTLKQVSYWFDNYYKKQRKLQLQKNDQIRR